MRASRTRRAMSCAYWAPKLTTTTGRAPGWLAAPSMARSSVTRGVSHAPAARPRHGGGRRRPDERRVEPSGDRPEHRCVALTAAAAEPDGRGPAAAATELVERGEGEARPRHPDRVAERDRTPV